MGSSEAGAPATEQALSISIKASEVARTVKGCPSSCSYDLEQDKATDAMLNGRTYDF